MGFTQLALDKKVGTLNEVQEEYLTDVHKSATYLLSLINDILDLSKVEAGKMELQPTGVRLRNLLENSLVMIKEKALQHGIKLSHDLNGIPDIITADERKLKQIMYNLLSNAVKFTPDGGRVKIKASEYKFDQNNGISENKAIKPRIKISVSDTGIGLNPDDFISIFDSFEQADKTASRRFQGTGLGLSLTKKLVELHDGKIWVESEGEGKGATFLFCIPVK